MEPYLLVFLIMPISKGTAQIQSHTPNSKVLQNMISKSKHSLQSVLQSNKLQRLPICRIKLKSQLSITLIKTFNNNTQTNTHTSSSTVTPFICIPHISDMNYGLQKSLAVQYEMNSTTFLLFWFQKQHFILCTENSMPTHIHFSFISHHSKRKIQNQTNP